jgi:hypothetical protein
VYLKMEPDCRSDIYICIKFSGLSARKGTRDSSDRAEQSRSRRKVLANCVSWTLLLRASALRS